MKTDQTRTTRDTDHGVDVTGEDRAQTGARRSPRGRIVRAVAAGVGGMLLMLLLLTVAALITSNDVEGPTVQTSPLLDQSVRARDHAAEAAVAQRLTPVVERLEGGHEAEQAQQRAPALLDQSVQARDHAGQLSDAQVELNARAVERAALIEQRHGLLTPDPDNGAQLRQSTRAAERAAVT